MTELEMVSKDDKKIEIEKVYFTVGEARGGHSHKDPEELFVAYGELKLLTLDIMNIKNQTERVIKGGESIFIPPDTAHMITAGTDALIFCKRFESKTTMFPPYRKIVEEYRAEHAPSITYLKGNRGRHLSMS